MAEEDQSQKTEQPTPQRLRKAQEEGRFALSKELTQFFAMTGYLVIFLMVLPTVAKKVFDLLYGFLEYMHAIDLDQTNAFVVIKGIMTKIFGYLGFVLAILIIAPLAAGYIQTGLQFNLKNLKFDLAKISPGTGLKKLFGWSNILELIKAILKIIAIGLLIFFSMRPEFKKAEHYLTAYVGVIIGDIYHEIISLLFIMSCILLVFSLLDFAYQRYSHLEKLKMSKHEIKEERKQAEGDPHMKQKLRRQMQELSRRSLIASVPRATVVITNPTHYSVALEYDQETMEAPTVVAKGIDYVALRIRTIAREHDVAIVANAPLARQLYNNVEVDGEILEEHYEAVARIIRYVIRMN